MARKRMIDPSIWQDEGMAELTPRQQLMYIGLFSNADDDGRICVDPTFLSRLFPSVFQDLAPGCVRADATKVVQVMGLRLDVNKGGWFAVIPDYRRFVVHSELRMIWNRLAKRLRPLILERDRRRCVRCGSTERLEVDHVISLARGGSSEVENLQTLCLPCNRAKGAR